MNAGNRRRGATLVEAVAAILVMGIALPPLVGLFSEVSAHGVEDTLQSTAVRYAESLMEEIVSKAFEDPDLPSGSFGSDGESRSDYDDIDDFDGLVNSPPRRQGGQVLDEYGVFTRSAFVDNVLPANPDPATPEGAGSTDLKRIRVVVSWSQSRGGEFTLTTLRARLGSPTPTSPIDIPAATASATKLNNLAMGFDIVNTSGQDLVLESVAVNADANTGNMIGTGIGPYWLWFSWAGPAPPTGTISLTGSPAANRTIPVGQTALLDFYFWPAPNGTVNYTVDLVFTNGTSVTVPLTINW